MSSHIGELNENPLHAALKAWYARPADRLEVALDGYVIDIVQGERLVEIQTGNFSAIKRKLTRLVERHPLRLVYPIAREKWLLKLPQAPGEVVKRRKSPKRGRYVEVFRELVSFPELIGHTNFALEVLLIQEEEVRRYDGRRRWRNRGWVTEERRLLDVVERRLFKCPADLADLLPAGLPERFTTADLAAAMSGSRRLAQKAAYCLRKADVLTQVGRRGRAKVYTANTAEKKEIE